MQDMHINTLIFRFHLSPILFFLRARSRLQRCHVIALVELVVFPCLDLPGFDQAPLSMSPLYYIFIDLNGVLYAP